ncbi:hypothetical protein J3E69DRAFT_198932 [Trichoderma sp. SZMC 28015]
MYSLNGPNCHMKGLRALITKALFFPSPGKTPRGTKMMEGFQSRVSEPNSSGLSDWIPVAACQPWAVRTYSSQSGGSIDMIPLPVLRTARHVPRQQAILFCWPRNAC